ncbi:MAG TPA: class I SAM-dependent methyltransferase [Actinomycetota bacterium]|nr:class I SAM-dependent methyltransferase [Actinomycetota bacterium]
MTVRKLPRVVPFVGEPWDPVGADHPMRRVTREVALGEGWTPEIAADVGALFDQLAGEWHTRDKPDRYLSIADALERGGPFAEGLAVELGSGTGMTTRMFAERFPLLVAVDLSMEMLRLAPHDTPRIRADGSRLPFADDSVSTLLLVNMLLFPQEVDRVLRRDGALVWVNTAGEHTPIYLSAEDVDSALPGDWDVVTAAGGRGSWSVARRA